MEDICDFMEELINLIADALETEGFVVERDSVPMRARKGEEEYSVILIRNQDELNALNQMEIQGKIIVLSMIEGIEPFGDLFMDRKKLECMVGRAVIMRLTGEKATKGSIISSFEDAFAEHREPVAAIDYSIDFESRVEEAFSSVKELLPFYVYHFSVDDGENSESGIILIDAINGEVFRAKRSFTADSGEISSLTRVEPSMSEEESSEKIIEYLIKEHTREEEIVKEDGAVTVMEKKTVTIDREDISLRYLGVMYLPFLKIEGPEGTESIDMSGITG